VAPTEREISDAYTFALNHAERQAPRPAELTEAARDAATDAVLWAIKNFKPALGEFGPFVRAAVRRIVRFGVAKKRRKLGRRPLVFGLPMWDSDSYPQDVVGDELDARPVHGVGEIELPLSVRELEPELRDAVRLFYVDRFGLRECALLLGVSLETVRRRLARAARLLGQGSDPPRRGTGEKRMTR
jgi:DNA-directed RNA polymerase specialized sigma24 family protein